MRLPGRYGRVVLLPAAPVQPPTGQAMSFLRWGNGGALTDPTSVPAREPSPARNSGKDKFLCPFSSLKKTPYRSKVQNVYIQEDTLTGGYRYSRGVEHLHIAEQPYSPKQCLWFAWPAIRAPWNIEDGELLYAHIRITIREIATPT